MAKHIAFSSRASGRCEEELGAPSHTCTGKLSSFPVTQEMRCQTIPCGRQMKWETKAIYTFRSVGNCLVYPCAFPVVSDLPSPSLWEFWSSLHTLSHQALLLPFTPFPALLRIVIMGLLTLGDHFCWSGFDDRFSHVWEDLFGFRQMYSSHLSVNKIHEEQARLLSTVYYLQWLNAKCRYKL